MRGFLTPLLIALVVFETAILTVFLAKGYRTKVAVQASYEIANENPLLVAIELETPETKFEELVKKSPHWVVYRPDRQGSPSQSVLEDCIFLRKTNYARILIKHGADVHSARRFFQDQPDELTMLEQLLREEEM